MYGCVNARQGRWAVQGVRAALCCAGLLSMFGCANKIDRVTIDKVLARAQAIPDVERACRVGHVLGIPVESVTKAANPPRKARIVSDVSSGMCAEDLVREAQLDAARAERNFSALGNEALVAEIKDARERETRARQAAAMRFRRGFDEVEQIWGPVWDECVRVPERDQIVYLLGLTSGLTGLIHDRNSGGLQDLPLDLLLKVGRASNCLDNERWWHVPGAALAGAWASIPGSGPEGVDPWEQLEAEATAGEASGVRLARALQVLIAANSGRSDVVESSVRAFAASEHLVPSDPTYALLDEYSRVLIRHESDLIWMAAAGHRTQTLGEFPADDEVVPEDDMFGADPFGIEEDPFNEPEPDPSPEVDGAAGEEN